MAEGGNGKSTSGNRDSIAPDLLVHKAGNSGGMGVLTADLRCMCKGYMLLGRGGAPSDMVKTGGRK